MAAIIAFLLERQNKNLRSLPDRIGDKLLGKPRKVFIITGHLSYFDQKPGTCWWFLSNLPTGEKELFLKEAGKFALGWIGGLASPVLGLELPATAKDAAEAVTPSGGLLKEAVDAAVWELVRKTDNAWVIAIKNCFLGGCAAFEKSGNDYKIWLKRYPANLNQSVEGSMMSAMGMVDKLRPNDEAGGIKLTREWAMGGGSGFSMSEYGEIQELARHG